MTRTLLVTSGLPIKLWVDAISTAVYLIKRLPTPILHWSSPFYSLFGTLPSYDDLRTFGCACYPYLRAYLTKTNSKDY